MEALAFYEEYMKPIQEGIKTSTIRKNFTANIGDQIGACNAYQYFGVNPKYFGYLKITSIEYIRFDDINKEIARTEGYLHENILKKALYDIYEDKGLKDSTLLYYIQFEFIPLEDDENEPTE